MLNQRLEGILEKRHLLYVNTRAAFVLIVGNVVGTGANVGLRRMNKQQRMRHRHIGKRPFLHRECRRMKSISKDYPSARSLLLSGMQ